MLFSTLLRGQKNKKKKRLVNYKYKYTSIEFSHRHCCTHCIQLMHGKEIVVGQRFKWLT